MRRTVLAAALTALSTTFPLGPALSQVGFTSELTVSWEVKSRFRLFRYETDFLKHVDAERGDGILAAEQRLARATDGHGWARTMLNGLCVDASGKLVEICDRDGEKEIYLSPTDHKVGVLVPNAPPGASCAWTFENGEDVPQAVTVPCTEEVRLRVRYGRPMVATADIPLPDGSIRRATAEILVRDVLIAGLGDSIAAGEGNPDRQITLTDEGFCFRRFLGTSRSDYYRPGRAGYHGNRSCEGGTGPAGTDHEWTQQRARWMSAACHRSLYGYQVRTALALAVENPHLAVTFIPLACTGAQIGKGVLDQQVASEIVCVGRGACPKTVPAQLIQLRDALALARRHRGDRTLDLVLLTVGANDIHFSELVANALLDQSAERTIFKRSGMLASVEEAQQALASDLPGSFARLRGALKTVMGGDLSRVVYVSYTNPALQPGGAPCPGGRDGFDIHPAFALDARQVRHAAEFVGARVPAPHQGAGAVPGRRELPRRRAHDLRGRPPGSLRRPRRVRTRAERSRLRPGLLCGGRPELPQEPGRRRRAAVALRPQRARVPPLCAARALDPHRQRQLFHRHDLPGRPGRRRSRPTSMTPPGGSSARSMAAPSTRPPKATRSWPMRRSPRRAASSASPGPTPPWWCSRCRWRRRSRSRSSRQGEILAVTSAGARTRRAG